MAEFDPLGLPDDEENKLTPPGYVSSWQKNPPVATSLEATTVAPPVQDPLEGKGTKYVPSWEKKQAAQSGQLDIILRLASEGNADDAAEVQRLSKETGIPSDLVGRNPEEIQRIWRQRRLDEQDLARTNPIVAKQLTDRRFAEIAWDDIENLTTTETLFNFFADLPGDAVSGWQKGVATNEMGYLGYRAKIGTASEEDLVRFNSLNSELREKGRLGWVGNTTTIVGQFLDSGADALGFATASGMAYAGVTALVGQAGPQAAIPEEVLTVPAAFGTGFYVGYVAKTTEQSFRIEAGHSYMDMIEAGVSKDVAQHVSTGVGLVNAGLNFVGLSAVAAPIRKQLTRTMTEKVADALKRPGMSGAIKNFAGMYSKAWAGEVSTEIAQEMVTLFGTELGKKLSPGEFEMLLNTPEGQSQIADTIIETFIVVGQGMSILALPGAGFNLSMDMKAARQAKRDQQFIQDLGLAVDESKVKGRNPEAYKEFINAQAAGTQVENVYIDAEVMVDLLNQQGVTIEQMDNQIPGISQQIELAGSTGGDVIISTGDYASTLAGTEVGTAMEPNIRVTQDGMSANEAIAFQSQKSEMMDEAKAILETETEQKKIFNAEAATVRKTVLDMVKQTGAYSDKVSSTYANFFRDFVVVQANKMGITPKAFYDKYGYQVIGQMQDKKALQDSEVLSQEGFVYQPTNEVLTNSAPFKNWFKNSSLVNEDGSPQQIYHGTADNISSFDLDNPNRLDSGWLGTGIYMTDSPILAKIYAEKKATKKRTGQVPDDGGREQIMPLYARLENPYYATLDEKYQVKAGGRAASDAFTQDLIDQGYDGVIMPLDADSNEIVVFEPSAVKSVFNDGTWSRETSEILSQKGRVATSTPAFKKWFGDSQVVDANGNPLVVYHGTDVGTDFVSFDTTDMGSWFAVNPSTAQPYTEREGNDSGRIIPAYLSIKNPLRIPEDIDLSNEATVQESLDRINDDNGTTFDAVELGLDPEYQGNAFEWLGGWEPRVIQAFKDAGFDGISAYEIGEITWAAFEPTQIKSVFNNGEFSTSDANILNQRARAVPVEVDDLTNVEANFEFAGSRKFATNREFKIAIQDRTKAAAKEAKVDLSEMTLGVEQYLVRVTLADAITALRTNPNAVGWYNEKVTKALRTLSLIHPELATDQEAKFAFTWALAATSNGLKVNKNFELAEISYRYYKENGVMPTDIKAGTAQAAINQAMGLFNNLVARDGMANVERFMTTMHTAKEVSAYTGLKVSGESPATMVYGAAAIGPKIGNGFFANLYGHFEQLTMDRWLMRTWGRWTGTLVEINKEQIKAKQTQLKALIKSMDAKQKKAFEKIIGIKLSVGKIDQVGNAIKKASAKPDNRVLMNEIGLMGTNAVPLKDGTEVTVEQVLLDAFGPIKGNQKRIGLGDQMRKVGNALSNYNDGQKEAPSGPVERRAIRNVFQQALTLLQQDQPSLTMADLQALLWYPEKRLYDAAKTKDEDANTGYEDDAAPDYANAAASLAREQGVSEAEINRVIQEVDDELRANTVSPGDIQPGQRGRSTGANDDLRGAGGSETSLNQQGRNGGGRYSSGSLAPLEGAPKVVGATGPDPRLVDVAERYAAANGIDLRRQSEFVEIDFERATAIAAAYEAMPHDPTDPMVAEAYQNLINQTFDQYQALVDAGYEFYFVDENTGPDYLSTPWNAIRDLRGNQRMGVYPTEAGFGQEATAGAVDQNVLDNPMLADTGLVWMDLNGNEKRVLANDLFRAVHDAFGHGLEGAGFRARGEENAWQAHVRLFTGSAVAAITTETRGQNSWLNYGPFGEKNATAVVADTIFADQKTGLMPEFTWTEGRAGDQQTLNDLRQESLETSEQEAQSRGAQFNQPNRGGFNPSNLTTMLNEGADYSTFLHETAHFFLHVYADMASLADATPEMQQDMQTILDWFGVKDVQTWNTLDLEQQRKYHEQFAYSYEIYLFEGKAPNTALQDMFDKFTRWLTSVYTNIRDELNTLYRQENGTDLPILTDEIRSVMDRMVASEQAINEAEAVRNMTGMFQTQEQSGMADAEWAAYQDMLEEAHDTAVTDLQRASIRQVKWLSNARSRIIKDLQKEADAERKQIKAEVSEAVIKEPVYKLMEFLKRGIIDGEQVSYATKLNVDEIRAMYGVGEMLDSIRQKFRFGKYGMLGKENSIHPEQAAEMFGFPSAYAMVQSLLNARTMKEEIDARTDARMLEENAGMDEASQNRKIEEALHNEARARFIAVELRFLTKATQPVRAMTAAAKIVAKQIIAARQIGSVKTREYTTAEAKQARAATQASKNGDPKAAAKAKQNQLVQNQLAKEAIASKLEISKALAQFKKLFKADKTLAKSRNMDLVNAARSILAAYSLGKSDTPPAQYIQKIKDYDPDLYETLEPLLIDASSGGRNYQELTLDEFRNMRDLVDALWFQSKREKQIMIDGQAMQLEAVTDELTARLEEIGLPDVPEGMQEAPGTRARIARSLNTAKALLRRVEHWAHATDGAAGVGAFTKYIWRPVREGIVKYRTERTKYVKRYVELVSKLDLQKLKISSTELGYTFGSANGGLGKAELLGALFHTGNISNYRKLLLGGRGANAAWGIEREDGTLDTSRWDAFITRMIDEGILTKADFDFVQAVWDLNEEMKPIAQKAHKDIFGYYFNEVEASPVVTPFGTYRGGYVPAKVDAFLVGDATRNAKMEELEADFRQSMPTTGMGFTKGRVDYNKPLDLDVRKMTAHIDSVLRFAYIQPAIKDVLKILKNRKFSDTLNAIDPGAIEEMLLPWLNRAARQQTSVAGMNRSMDKFWNGVRNRTGISIMFANLTNALQQFTGYFPALLLVNKTHVKAAMWQYIKNPHVISNEIAGLSPFMEDRMKNQIFDIQETLNDLLLNPTKFAKVQKWGAKHGYFIQQAFQNQVDAVVWMASYNESLANSGVTESDVKAQKEAVAVADANVRLTQDSLVSEDIAAFQVGSPFYKSLIQFSGYFNMLANLNASEFTKIFRDLGWRGNKGKLAMTYMLGFGLPMLLSDLIVRTLGNDFDDDDDDGYIDEVAEWFFMSQIRGATALIPVVGSAIAVPFNSFNDKVYDDRMTTSPSVSTLEAATVGVVRAGINVANEKDLTGKNVKDVITLLSLVTGVPLTVLGKPIGYAMDVESGKINPTSDGDYVRGLITGRASEGSR